MRVKEMSSWTSNSMTSSLLRLISFLSKFKSLLLEFLLSILCLTSFQRKKKSSAFPYIQSSSFLIDLIFLSLIPGVAVMHVLSSFRVKIRRTCLFLGETSTTFFCIQMQNFPRMWCKTRMVLSKWNKKERTASSLFELTTVLDFYRTRHFAQESVSKRRERLLPSREFKYENLRRTCFKVIISWVSQVLLTISSQMRLRMKHHIRRLSWKISSKKWSKLWNISLRRRRILWFTWF